MHDQLIRNIVHLLGNIVLVVLPLLVRLLILDRLFPLIQLLRRLLTILEDLPLLHRIQSLVLLLLPLLQNFLLQLLQIFWRFPPPMKEHLRERRFWQQFWVQPRRALGAGDFFVLLVLFYQEKLLRMVLSAHVASPCQFNRLLLLFKRFRQLLLGDLLLFDLLSQLRAN